MSSRRTIGWVVVSIIVFFGWASPCPAASQRTIIDMLGNTITVPDPLQRVALFGGPSGQVAYLLGVRDKVCAVSKAMKASDLLAQVDPSMSTMPAPRGTAGHIQLETMIMAEPQLVVAGELDGSIVSKKTGLPVAYIKSDMGGGQAVLKKDIRFYARVFDAQARGEQFIEYLDRITALVRSRTADIEPAQRKVVFHGYGPAHLVTLGGDTFIKERIDIAGCVNATDRIDTTGKREGLHFGLDEVSMEQVLMWNPDLLIIDTGTPQSILDDPRWQAVKAVRRKQVFVQPIGIFIWDRPTAEAAVLHPLWLAKIAYPERFKDVDMVAEVTRFYKEIMGFELTRDQAQKILGGGFKVHFGGVGAH
jgi:iron complex transport system substrate-binding protein